MIAYVQHRSKTGDRLATIHIPNLKAFLTVDRESTRQSLKDVFETMFKKECCISFEDECPMCGGDYDGTHCSNYECECGFPPQANLRRLMKDRPPKAKESADAYLRTLKTLWRAEQAGADAANCLKNL